MEHHDNVPGLADPIVAVLEQAQANGAAPQALLGDRGPAASPSAAATHAANWLLRFMDEMPGGFLIYRAAEGERILYANRALLRIFQCDDLAAFLAYTKGSFRGVVHPDDLDAVEASIGTQIQDSRFDLDYVEYRIIRPDGTIRWIEDHGHFVHSDAVGDIFYVFLSDATEKRARRLAEQEQLLREKDRKLRTLIEKYDQERALIDREYLRQLEVIEGLSINYEAILYIDLELDQALPYRTNDRCQLLFGDSVRAFSWFTGEYVRRWVHPEDREMLANVLSPAYMRQKLSADPTYYINYRATENAEVQYLQLRAVNVGPFGGVTQIVIGFRRVDEELRREMEQKQLVAEALNNADLAIAAKNTFLSNMSHDMRTPLNALFGHLTLAKKDLQDTGALRVHLERAEAASQVLRDLIDKLLEMSWSGSGEMHLEDARCDLRGLLREATASLQTEASAKNIELVLEDAGIVHSAIFSDPGKLRQAVLHLMKNAITYTKPNGHVRVSMCELAQLPNHYADYRLIVADSGIGISEAFLTHIFEPFAREKNTTLSGVHGIGLGLTIVKNIVEMMGGSLEIQSEVGKGSTFTVNFRFRLQQPEAAAGPKDSAAPVGLRILLVEDNEINREIETELLEDQGFVVDTAVDGSVAVEMLRQASPGDHDVVLMDLQMPVMDGYQAAREIRRLPDPQLAEIPIIALSANVFESDVRASLASGMDAHLAKPLDLAQLLQTIARVVQR